MYAIVRTGGKQYRVEEGRSLDVELLPAKEGASVELDNVLLIADNGDLTVGTPLIEGARVLADVESHGRQKKIVVFKYKAKVRTRKKTGHRQHFTRLAVTEILRPGQESKVVKPKRKTRRPAAKAKAPVEETADVAVAEAGVTAAAPATKAAPKRTRKPAAPKASGPADAGEAEASAPAAKPKRRRKPAAPKAAADATADAGKAEAEAPAAAPDEKPKPKRTRKPAAPKAEADDKAGADKKPARKRATKKAGEDKE